MLCRLPIFALAGFATLCQAASPGDVLAESRRRLASYPALSADLSLVANLPTGRCESMGRYVAGTFPKLRVETTATLGEVTLKSVDVCDGQVLWSLREMTAEGENPDVRVVRCDAERVRQELATVEVTPEGVLAAELAVGGLAGLLAGLEAAYDFEEATTDRGSRLLVGSRRDGGSPIPIQVRVTLDAATLIPTRVLYVGDRDGEPYAVLNMELRNVSAAAVTDESVFRFTPPREVEISNRTDETLRAIRGE